MASSAANIIVQPVTISSGTTTSNEADLTRGLLAGIIMPAAMTGATFKIQTSNVSGGTFVDIVNSAGTAVYDAIPVSVGSYIQLDVNITAGLGHIQIVSASSEGADRELKLMYKQAS